jgi:hypothetical protein
MSSDADKQQRMSDGGLGGARPPREQRRLLSEWYGERTCHNIFSGSLVADGYGVLDVPGRAPLHFLVELDRGTETTARLREKAKAYAASLPTSSLGKLDPLCCSSSRARGARKPPGRRSHTAPRRSPWPYGTRTAQARCSRSWSTPGNACGKAIRQRHERA